MTEHFIEVFVDSELLCVLSGVRQELRLAQLDGWRERFVVSVIVDIEVVVQDLGVYSESNRVVVALISCHAVLLFI